MAEYKARFLLCMRDAGDRGGEGGFINSAFWGGEVSRRGKIRKKIKDQDKDFSRRPNRQIDSLHPHPLTQIPNSS